MKLSIINLFIENFMSMLYIYIFLVGLSLTFAPIILFVFNHSNI